MSFALTQEIAARYHLAGNTLLQQAIADPVNGIKVEIGDSKQPDFQLQAKFMRWGNEVNFSARLDTTELDAWDTSQGELVTEDNKVIWRKANYSVVWYDLGFDDDGGFEHQVIFREKPPFSRLRWTLRTKGLTFSPQGALTPEEIAEGCSRPDDIVDSIAVYAVGRAHHRVGGKNYRSGKVKHLKRIILIDAAGKQAYGTQAINIANEAGDGEWLVEWDKAWMDAATDDVVVDPTIGYSTIGGTSLGYGHGNVAICSLAAQYTASAGDSITKFSIVTSGSNGFTTIHAAAYEISGGVPINRVGTQTDIDVSQQFSQATIDSGTVSQSLTSGATYGVAIVPDTGNSSSSSIWYDNGSIPGRLNGSTTSLDNPFAYAGTDSGRHYSWWATVEAGGGDTDTLTAEQGAYALTGEAVLLIAGRALPMAQGSYSLTGESVGLTVGKVAALDQGGYTLDGQAVALTAARQMLVGQGSYGLTGKTVTLSAARMLALTYGAYVLTGEAVTLTYSPDGTTYTLAMGEGGYSLSGQAMAFQTGRKVTLSYATYALSGQAVELYAARAMAASHGSYATTGQNFGFGRTYNLQLATGNYAIAGQVINFTYGREISVIKLSPDRIFAIPADDRIFAIPAESRRIIWS